MGLFNFFLADATTAQSSGQIANGGTLSSDRVSSFWAPVSDFIKLIGDWFAEHGTMLFISAAMMIISVILSYLISYILRKVILKITNRTKTNLDSQLVDRLHHPLMLLLISSGVAMSILVLQLPPAVHTILSKIYYSIALISIIWGLFRVIAVFDLFLSEKARSTKTNLDTLLLNILRRCIKFIVWGFTIFFIAQNIFHLNVSALLAGAGVAGLAIAFAAQNTVANIFGAVMIILDRPFSIGDLIKMGGTTGIVEGVGLRSTNLRSLDGTLWSIPNRQISDASLENVAKRPNVKHVFDLGLVYGTTPEQMKMAMEILHEILDNKEFFDMEEFPPRIYFNNFNDWSLNINVIIWFQSVDFFEVQEWRSQVNSEILEKFNKAGLEFAFPTSTNYIIGNK